MSESQRRALGLVWHGKVFSETNYFFSWCLVWEEKWKYVYIYKVDIFGGGIF